MAAISSLTMVRASGGFELDIDLKGFTPKNWPDSPCACSLTSPPALMYWLICCSISALISDLVFGFSFIGSVQCTSFGAVKGDCCNLRLAGADWFSIVLLGA